MRAPIDWLSHWRTSSKVAVTVSLENSTGPRPLPCVTPLSAAAGAAGSARQHGLTGAPHAATSAEHAATSAGHAATSAEHAATSAEHAATSAEHAATSAEHAATARRGAGRTPPSGGVWPVGGGGGGDRSRRQRRRTTPPATDLPTGPTRRGTGLGRSRPAESPTPSSAESAQSQPRGDEATKFRISRISSPMAPPVGGLEQKSGNNR